MSPAVQMALWLAAALAGVLLSGLFSGLETGVYTLNRLRLRVRSESGDASARMLARLLGNGRSLLASLLIGTNIATQLCSLAIVAFCSYKLLWDLPEWAISIIVPLVLAPVLVIFSEIVPKNVFRHYSDRYTYPWARALFLFRRLLQFTGVLLLVDGLTHLLVRATRISGENDAADLFHPRQQVGSLIRESSHQGALTPYQSALIDRVMNLRNVTVGQAMIPMAKVQSVPADWTIGRLAALLRNQPRTYSRMPVVDGARFVGVVNTNEALASADGDGPITPLVYDTARLGREASVPHAIFALQRARRAMGLVADASGKPLGIATIKDLVEEITGEIEEW
ncbi:MAG: hypothetical protein BIFFINMI_01905 [Phycisphaerae bacterium]|nr:hypothetical protein [Phycisphaerae bacterium]